MSIKARRGNSLPNLNSNSTESTLSSFEKKFMRQFSSMSASRTASGQSRLTEPLAESPTSDDMPMPVPRAIYSPVNSKHSEQPGYSPNTASPNFRQSTTKPLTTGLTGLIGGSGTSPLQSFKGCRCCFCEEDFANSLRGEVPLALVCSHVSHFECWKQLSSLDQAQSSAHIESNVPLCGTCDQAAIPADEAVLSKIFRKPSVRDARRPHRALSTSSSMQSPINFSHYTEQFPTHNPASPGSSAHTSPMTTPTQSDLTESPPTPSSTFHTSAVVNDLKRLSIMDSSIPSQLGTFGAVHGSTTAMTTGPPSIAACTESTGKLSLRVAAETSQLSLNRDVETYVTAAVTVCVDPNYFKYNRYTATREDGQCSESAVASLRESVLNQYNVDLAKCGPLRIWGELLMSTDGNNWTEVVCYLFGSRMVLAKAYIGHRLAVRGCMNLETYIAKVDQPSPGQLVLYLNKPGNEVLYLEGSKTSSSPVSMDIWRTAIADSSMVCPLQAPISLTSTSGLPQIRRPTLSIFCFTLSLGDEVKFSALQALLRAVIAHISDFDRLALVLYGLPGGSSITIGPHRKLWPQWEQVFRQIKQYGSSIDDPMSAMADAARLLQTLAPKSWSNPDFSATVYYICESSTRHESLSKCCGPILSSVPIDTFGMGDSHCSQTLAELSQASAGCYTCVRYWEDLTACVKGRLRYNESRVIFGGDTTGGINIQFSGLEDVTIVSNVVGHDEVIDCPNESDPKQSRTPINSFNRQISFRHMVAGESRTVLVQICVPPSCVFDEWKTGSLDLLSVKVTDESCTPPVQYTELLSLSTYDHSTQQFLAGNACYNGSRPQTLTDNGTSTLSFICNVTEPPNPVYGNLLIGATVTNHSTVVSVKSPPSPTSTPFYLGVEPIPEIVVKRRLELAAEQTFNNVLRGLIRGHENTRLLVSEGGSLLQGILNSSMLGPSSSSSELLRRIVLYMDNLCNGSTCPTEQIQLINHAIGRLRRGTF